MYYQEFSPPSFLADYVQIIWIQEDIKTNDFNTKERILPDGIVELVFHYGDPYLTHNSIGNTQEQPRSFAISQIQDFIEIQSNGRTGMISVRFFPWGAYHFFKTPIRDFIDDTIETSNLWPHQYSEVQDRIESATNNLQRLNIIKDFLMNSLKENYQNCPAVDRVIQYIRQTKGSISIDALCETTGFNKKQLERKFLATVGTTPKQFSRGTRFLNLCHHLKEHKHQSLTELTYDCGYYDQAHFIKEFKQFSGFTPKEFFKRDNIAFSSI